MNQIKTIKQATTPIHEYFEEDDKNLTAADGHTAILISSYETVEEQLQDFVKQNKDNPAVDTSFLQAIPGSKNYYNAIRTSYNRNCALSHWDSIQEKYGDKINEIVETQTKQHPNISPTNLALSLGFYAYQGETENLKTEDIHYMLEQGINFSEPLDTQKYDPYVHNTNLFWMNQFFSDYSHTRGMYLLENTTPESRSLVHDYLKENGWSTNALQILGQAKNETQAHTVGQLLQAKRYKDCNITLPKADAILEATNQLIDYNQQFSSRSEKDQKGKRPPFNNSDLRDTVQMIAYGLKENKLSIDKTAKNSVQNFVEQYLASNETNVYEFGEMFLTKQKATIKTAPKPKALPHNAEDLLNYNPIETEQYDFN